MTNQQYMEDMPFIANAVRNKVYLDTLNNQQIVASILIDLAYAFLRKNWISDGKFITECVDYGMNFFHNKEAHSEGLLLKDLILAARLDQVLYAEQITDLNDIEESPEALKLYQEYRSNSDKISRLGVRQFSDEKYNAMLKKHDTRGKLQAANGIDTKSKKSLFCNLSKK